MPLYDFECISCGHRFSLQESIAEHDRHREQCPKCQSRETRQLVSVAAVKTAKKS